MGSVKDGVRGGQCPGNRQCAEEECQDEEGACGRQSGVPRRRGQCEEEPAPKRKGQCKTRAVSVGEDSASMKRHIGDQCPEEEGSCGGWWWWWWGTGRTKQKEQCSGGQCNRLNARLKGQCGGREWSPGEEASGGEAAEPGEGTVQLSFYP